ncbi:hypothetical protein ACWD6I_30745 [Streptomyces sp. NPDC002454]
MLFSGKGKHRKPGGPGEGAHLGVGAFLAEGESGAGPDQGLGAGQPQFLDGGGEAFAVRGHRDGGQGGPGAVRGRGGGVGGVDGGGRGADRVESDPAAQQLLDAHVVVRRGAFRVQESQRGHVRLLRGGPGCPPPRMPRRGVRGPPGGGPPAGRVHPSV